MIVLKIISGLLAFALSPVVILLFFVQSKHIVYYLGTTVVFLLFCIFTGISYQNLFAGMVLLALLCIIQYLIYQRRQDKLSNGKLKNYITGYVDAKNNTFKMDFIVSLFIIKLVTYIPFPIRIKVGKNQSTEVDIRDIVKTFFENGKDTSIDVDSKDAVVNFKIV